jgi:hypothetical protein
MCRHSGGHQNTIDLAKKETKMSTKLDEFLDPPDEERAKIDALRSTIIDTLEAADPSWRNAVLALLEIAAFNIAAHSAAGTTLVRLAREMSDHLAWLAQLFYVQRRHPDIDPSDDDAFSRALDGDQG